MNRREFLEAMAGAAVQIQSPRRISIEPGGNESFRRRLAPNELLRGLHRLGFGIEERAGTGSLNFAFRVEPGRWPIRCTRCSRRPRS